MSSYPQPTGTSRPFHPSSPFWRWGNSVFREGNAPISYKRSPFLNDPEYIDGYDLVRTFMSIRGRQCYVYRDTTTGEEIYSYARLHRSVI